MSNKVTAEEEGWMQELRKAAVKASVPVPPRFWLASFAIVSKGDVKKGLKRMKNFQQVEEQYKLSECSAETATEWFRKTFPTWIINVGSAKSGRIGYGLRAGHFDPTLIQTEQDWQFIAKTLVLNLQSVIPTISHVRDGMASVSDMSGMGFKNFSPSAEKRLAAVYQDAFPVKMKEIYIVNPPSIFNWILKLARLFIKQKIIDRIHFMAPEQMIEFFDPSCLPSDFGGSFNQDFFNDRATRLELHHRSVEEMEGGQN